MAKRSLARWKRPLGMTLFGLVAGAVFLGYMAISFSLIYHDEITAMTTDSQGNLYLADVGQAHLKKYDSQGNLLMTIGQNGKKDGQFIRYEGPKSVAVDRSGNIYATQVQYDNNGFIQKFDSNGNFLFYWQPGQAALGIVTDSQNNVYVNFKNAPFVQKYNDQGRLQSGWLSQLDPVYTPKAANNLLIDNQDNLYVDDTETGLLLKYSPQGQFLSSQARIEGGFPGKMALDRQGQFYTANQNHEIRKLSNSGQLLASWNKQPPAKDDNLTWIHALTIDRQGNTYITYRNDGPYVVQKFEPNGQLVKEWSFGLPAWVSPFGLQALMPFLMLAIIVLFRLFFFSQPADLTGVEQKFPLWVKQAQADPKVLQAHLKQPTVHRKSPGKGNFFDSLVITIVSIIWAIACIVALFSAIGLLDRDDEISLAHWLTVGISLAIAVGFGFLLLNQVKKTNEPMKIWREELIKQALSDLPAKDRAVFVSRHWINWADVARYLLTNLPNLIFSPLLIALSFGKYNEKDWFGWVIQIAVVTGLFGLLMFTLWLRNIWQKPGLNSTQLTRVDFFDLYKRFGLCYLLFVVLGAALHLFNNWIVAATANYMDRDNFSEFTILAGALETAKYAGLLLGLGLAIYFWLNREYRRGNYEAALRRIAYLRRWITTPSIRRLHATRLRQAGRLNEAEYVLHEGLVNPQNWQDKPAAKLITALAQVRLDQGRYAEAVFLLETSMELTEYNYFNRVYLAELYLRLGIEPDRAMQLLNQAGEMKLYLPATNRRLESNRQINGAWAEAQSGEFADAETNLKEAFQRADRHDQPLLASIYYRVACIRQLQGNSTEAARQMEQAARLDPHGLYGQWASEALLTLPVR